MQDQKSLTRVLVIPSGGVKLSKRTPVFSMRSRVVNGYTMNLISRTFNLMTVVIIGNCLVHYICDTA